MTNATQWHIVDDSDSGVSIAISPEGRKRLADEQRTAQTRTEIRIGCLAAAVLCIAALILKHLWS